MLDVRSKPATRPRSAGRLVTVAGAAVFVAAYAWLIATGHTRIASSADADADRISLWAAALPALAAMAVARLVPSRSQPLPSPPRGGVGETVALVGCAVAMAVAALFTGHGLAHIGLKLVFLLAVPLLVLRLSRADRVALPEASRLAAAPAVLVWFVLAQLSPLRMPLPDDLPDPVALVVGSLVTLLTASVLEEFFYRRWLQTRLEALAGRWAGITMAALLFAAMHSARIDASAPLLGVATIVAVQGMFGLMLGYVWSRFRAMWAVVTIHVAANLVFVPMLVERLPLPGTV
ncbi:CPBP family intramembrane glutamic endopeptidase [Actinomadura gamaensis]|uniref:CPBP family intramembrane glutamic endopeptidase n=1 Tax=Actinomadura gamaensis TaxID=1763541 RepID=A0ABV9TWU3_9ACTN